MAENVGFVSRECEYEYMICIVVIIRAISFRTLGLLYCLLSSELQSLPCSSVDAFICLVR